MPKTLTKNTGEVEDKRPIKIRMIERYANLINAGELEDLEQARLTLSHPVFATMSHGFRADTNFQSLEDMRGILAWCEDPEHDKSALNQRLAELETERVQIEARLSQEQRAMDANRAKADDAENIKARWIGIEDGIDGRFMRCPIFHILPEFTERLKAAGLPVPKKANF